MRVCGGRPLDGEEKVSHAETICVGLKDHLADGKDVEVVSIFSSNQACDNSPAHSNGCQSIPRSEFGVDENVTFTFGAGCKAGGKKEPTFSFNKMAKVTGVDEGKVEQHYSSDSGDELIDTNSLRGKELGSRVDYDNALVGSFGKLNVDSKMEEMKNQGKLI